MKFLGLLPKAAIAILTFSYFVTAYYGSACYPMIREQIKLGNLSKDDPIFYRDADGQPMSDPDYPVLTLPGCEKRCGADHIWYRDIGPRLGVWLIPVFILISNMETSPLDKRRYLMIVHLLGDPVDSIWSLFSKVEAWSRCYALAKRYAGPHEREVRDLATVLACIEELVGPEVDPKSRLDMLLAGSRLSATQITRSLGRTALELADSRTDEIMRTGLAILLYVYQVIAAFVPRVGGGSTSPPGGRIGTAMFLSWLVPAVLLSNAMGGFTSRRTCIRILERFARCVSPRPRKSSECLILVLFSQGTTSAYFESQSWSGAIYTYRSKRMFAAGPGDHHTSLLCLLSTSPVIISIMLASIILWKTPPGGLSCRIFWILGIGLAWLLSASITWATWRFGIVTGKSHWRFTLAKDSIMAIPSVVIIFLSSSGLFNSCRCWSNVYTPGSRAYIRLNVEPLFEQNARTVYPALVAICLTLQLVVFGCMVYLGKNGLRIMRWSEKEKRQEWERDIFDDDLDHERHVARDRHERHHEHTEMIVSGEYQNCSLHCPEPDRHS